MLSVRGPSVAADISFRRAFGGEHCGDVLNDEGGICFAAVSFAGECGSY